MTANFPVKINIVSFKEWKNAILNVKKQIHYFKGQMVAVRVVK